MKNIKDIIKLILNNQITIMENQRIIMNSIDSNNMNVRKQNLSQKILETHQIKNNLEK